MTPVSVLKRLRTSKTRPRDTLNKQRRLSPKSTYLDPLNMTRLSGLSDSSKIAHN